MLALLLALRLVLAASFATAAVAKLRRARAFRASLRDFGLHPRGATILSLLLPLAEMGAALLLLPASSAWLGAAVSLTLIAVFSVAVTVALTKNRTPDCACFGQILHGPIGWHTLARNAGFIAVASVVVFAGPGHAQASAVGWVSRVQPVAGGLIGLAACGLGIAVVAHTWPRSRAAHGQRRVVPPRASPRVVVGTSAGETAPAFSLRAASGRQVTLDDLRRPGLPVLLVFFSPACTRCRAIEWPLVAWQTESRGVMTMAIVSRGSPEANRRLTERHGPSRVLLEDGHEVSRAYRASRTPAAVLITANGVIASPIASGAEAIEDLRRRVMAASARPVMRPQDPQASAPLAHAGEATG